MPHAGKTPVRRSEKAGERQREAEIRKVSERIGAIERECGKEGFDSAVVEDIGGMLTLGVCSRCGINLDAGRLGVSLLDEDRRSLELDMADRIRSKSGFLAQASEEVLRPFLKDPDRDNALAYWTTVSRRLDSKKPSSIERRWLDGEEKRQDEALMRDTGPGFKSALSRQVRKNALSLFSRIRRAGNKVPLFGRLFKFT